MITFPSLLKHTDLCDAGSSESHDDGYNIDSQLELKELGDAVVDVATPHHCFDNAAEVIIRQYDIWRLLGHICSSNTLEECRYSAVRNNYEKSNICWFTEGFYVHQGGLLIYIARESVWKEALNPLQEKKKSADVDWDQPHKEVNKEE